MSDTKDSTGSYGARRWLRRTLVTVAVVVLYAYAIQVTDINLEEPFEPNRQKNLIGLIRELARPDLFKYEGVTRSNNVSLRMPCPAEIRASQVTFEGRTMLLRPNCVSTTQDLLTLEGEGFPENVRGAIIWHPPGESATARRVADFRANAEGKFTSQFTMPDVRATEEVQQLEVVEILDRTIAGLSDTSKLTIQKITETVFMALMASTIGTILAVPLSFLAARNLMTDLGMPLGSLMSALTAAPLGGWIGFVVGQQLIALAAAATANSGIGLAIVLVAVAFVWVLLRWISGSTGGESASRPVVVGRGLFTLLLAIFALATLAQLGQAFGTWLDSVLGAFAFVGNFVYVVGDVTWVLLPAVLGFAGLLAAASIGSRLGQNFIMNQAVAGARAFTLIFTFLGSTLLLLAVTYGLDWICLMDVCSSLPQETPQLLLTLLLPSAAIGLAAAAMTWRTTPKNQYPVGTVSYALIRVVLNTLRSIEPIIMGIVFVVWVGLGPFAGILALTLHSVADLGKLFSEQVENIAEGPLEAITATGANRFQTIVFAVVPQVVPHYIAFTFYRWDINVRMSTIIGFVGGGGIGFVLQRHANLTQYRQASVMVIAIAVVVTLLDYVSSKIRSRII